MIALLAACIVLAGVSAALAAWLVLQRVRENARVRARRELREHAIGMISELLIHAPPSALPSTPEYREYVAELSGSVRTAARSSALARDVLRETLLDFMANVGGEARVRLERLYVLSGFADNAIERLASALWQERAYAARELGIARPVHALNLVCDILADGNPAVALEALRAALAIGGVKMIPRITHLLPAITPLEEIYLVELCRESGAKSAAHIVPMLTDVRADVKRFAIHALGAIRAAHSLPMIVPFLRSDDRSLAAAAANALGFMESGEALDALEAMCGQNACAGDLRARVAGALGRIGGARAERMLESLCGDSHGEVRAAAEDALAHIRLRQAFQTDNPARALDYVQIRLFSANRTGAQWND